MLLSGAAFCQLLDSTLDASECNYDTIWMAITKHPHCIAPLCGSIFWLVFFLILATALTSARSIYDRFEILEPSCAFTSSIRHQAY